MVYVCVFWERRERDSRLILGGQFNFKGAHFIDGDVAAFDANVGSPFRAEGERKGGLLITC